MMYEIENGVPIPPGGRGRISIYPFKKMNIGESFFVPIEGDDKDVWRKKRCSILASCRQNRVGNKKRFTTKKIDGGVRVWRIE